MEKFHEILQLASKKQGCAEKELVYKKTINTSVGKARKEPKDKPKGVKSAAVQAFLKKQQDDEKKKALEEKKKKEHLMKLRQEKNTVSQMNKMIKRSRTKEAIFEVEGNDKKGDESKTPTKKEDEDENITEYTKLKSQFGGKERKAIFNNIQRKQVSAHWVPKEDREKEEQKSKESSDCSSSKKHTKNSPVVEPSKPSKPSKSSDKIENTLKNVLKKHEEEKASRLEKEVKKKKKPPGPPPMNFNDLMKLAQEKKGDPSPKAFLGAGEKKKEKESKNKVKEPKMPDRPMSQDEKDRWLRVHSKKYQEWIKHGKARPDFCINTTPKKKRGSGTSPGAINPKTPAIVNDNDDSSTDEDDMASNPVKKRDISHPVSLNSNRSKVPVVNSKPKTGIHNTSNGGAISSGTTNNGKSVSNKLSSSQPTSKTLKLKSSQGLVSTSPSLLVKDSKQPIKGRPHSASSGSSTKSGVENSSKNSSQMSSKKNGKVYDQVHENVIVCGDSNSAKNMKMKPQQPETNPWDRIYDQVHKNKSKKPKPEKGSRKRVIESDSEQDSELEDFIASDEEDEDLDDFIDDSGAREDISSIIGNIFGYNRNKYRNEREDDISDMEAGFADIEKEEFISEQLGAKEDEEEMRKEEVHQRRKRLQKKKQLMESKKPKRS